MNAITFRRQTPDDYPAIAQLATLIVPEMPLTVSMLREADRRRDPKLKTDKIVALRAGQLVGFGSYNQFIDLYHPQKFWVWVRVHPAHRRRGIGTALFAQVRAATAPYTPIEFMTEFRDISEGSIPFVERHGFTLAHRRWDYSHTVQGFDETPWLHLLQKLENAGIQFKTVTQLVNDRDWEARLHELQWAIDSDVPFGDPITRTTLAEFKANVLESPFFVAEGTFVAVDGGEYVGMSSFYRVNDTILNTDLTGTTRSHRRRGIATALKVLGLCYARDHGYERIRTVNDDGNTGMMAINQQLGFQRDGATLRYRKTFV